MAGFFFPAPLTAEHAMPALNDGQLQEKLQVPKVYAHVKKARLLKIGKTEPRVVRNADSTDVYTWRFGLEIVPEPQSELTGLYEQTNAQQSSPIANGSQATAGAARSPQRQICKAPPAWPMPSMPCCKNIRLTDAPWPASLF